MSEPTRWRDEGPNDVGDLLRVAKKSRPMSSGDRSRTRGRVARTLGIAAAVGSFVWLEGAAIGACLALGVLGVAHFAPIWFGAPAIEIAPAPSAIAVPSKRVAPSASWIEEPAPSASVDAPPLRSAPKAVDAPQSAIEAPTDSALPADSLAVEAALLERARASLGSAPAQALAITEEHATEFPNGKLAMDRELLAIDALRRLGRTSEARARGEALLSRARGSVYEARIQKLLAGLP